MAKAKRANEQCAGTTKSGKQCRNQAVENGYCTVHQNQAPKGKRSRPKMQRETVYAFQGKDGHLGVVEKRGRPKSELFPEGATELGSFYIVSGTAPLRAVWTLLETAVVNAELPKAVLGDLVQSFEQPE